MKTYSLLRDGSPCTLSAGTLSEVLVAAAYSPGGLTGYRILEWEAGNLLRDIPISAASSLMASPFTADGLSADIAKSLGELFAADWAADPNLEWIGDLDSEDRDHLMADCGALRILAKIPGVSAETVAAGERWSELIC